MIENLHLWSQLLIVYLRSTYGPSELSLEGGSDKEADTRDFKSCRFSRQAGQYHNYNT